MTETRVSETHVNVDAVRVEGRHRRDLGDIAGLAKSIEETGLINPITLTTDYRLVAGGRRLAAYKHLGRGTIPARIVESLSDAAAALRAERDENTCRKDMLPSEKAALGAALYEVEAAAAKERQRAGQELGRAVRHEGVVSSLQGGNHGDSKREAAEEVGDALGMSRSTYSDLRFAHKTATDAQLPAEERNLALNALAEMDSGRGIQPAVNELRRKLRAKREAQEAKAAAMADPEPATASERTPDEGWIPAGGEKGPKPAARRRELIEDWAGKGWTSHQMSDRLGIEPGTVRRIARENNVTIHADQTLGRNTRKSIDSNRIVRETVNQLDGIEMSFDLIEFDDLDRSEIENWTVSLTKSIRVLNRLNKKLKEMVQ